MNISLHNKFAHHDFTRASHSTNNGRAVWRVTLVVLLLSNSLLLFSLYIYDVI